MEGFKKLVPKKCKVLRDGSVLILDAVELVPGGRCPVLPLGAALYWLWGLGGVCGPGL
jgi:hypothetical protein